MHRKLCCLIVLVFATAPVRAEQPVARPKVDRQIYQVDLTGASKTFTGEAPESVFNKAALGAAAADAVAAAALPKPPVFQFTRPEEMFEATVKLEGDPPLIAKTHLFGSRFSVIPYSDDDNVTDAAGNPVPRGDAAIAAYFAPGQVGYAIKNHRPKNRALALSGDVDDLREELKLQDTHIAIVIGVMRDGEPGAITANSPQDYLEGRFGDADYPMIFVRPRFPSFTNDATKKLLMENLRTMVIGFNAVAVFPDEYNGGDPLGVRDQKRVREHTAMMIRGIAGDPNAREYFRDDNHKIYCAELAFVSATAAMLVPLNDTAAPAVLQEFGDSPEKAKQIWSKFQAELRAHNAEQESTFDTLNRNTLIHLVKLADAASLAALKPLPEYADEKNRKGLEDQLAFPPMTVSDMIESFLKIYVPRQQLGEKVAPIQAALLKKVKPGILQAAAAQKGSEAANKLEQLMDRITEVVGKEYENYDQFRAAIAPLLEIGRKMTGPRPGDEAGLFVPPMLLHLVARGDMTPGLLGLDYVGHGLHYSLVRPVAVTP